MKKVLSFVCAMAVAATCTATAFAADENATPGQIAQEVINSIGANSLNEEQYNKVVDEVLKPIIADGNMHVSKTVADLGARAIASAASNTRGQMKVQMSDTIKLQESVPAPVQTQAAPAESEAAVTEQPAAAAPAESAAAVEAPAESTPAESETVGEAPAESAPAESETVAEEPAQSETEEPAASEAAAPAESEAAEEPSEEVSAQAAEEEEAPVAVESEAAEEEAPAESEEEQPAQSEAAAPAESEEASEAPAASEVAAPAETAAPAESAAASETATEAPAAEVSVQAAQAVQPVAAAKEFGAVKLLTASEQTVDYSQVTGSITNDSKNIYTLTVNVPVDSSATPAGYEVTVYGLDYYTYQMVYGTDVENGVRLDNITNVVRNEQNPTKWDVTFWVPHFSTYTICPAKVEDTNQNQNISTSSSSGSSSHSSSYEAPDDSIYYTCPKCGYHNWTATTGGYRCDHCGYLEEVKELAGWPNVNGVADKSAAAASVYAGAIKATGASMSVVALFALAMAGAVVGGAAYLVRKNGLGE